MITRRSALVGIGGLLAAKQVYAGDAKEVAKDNLLILGPLFLLGDIYKKATADGWAGEPLRIGADPGRDAIIAGLNEIQIWLLDLRDVTAPKKPVFADCKGYPLFLAGGKFSYDWAEGAKKLSIRISDLSAMGSDTDYDQAVPTRSLKAHLCLEFEGSTASASASCNFNMSSDRIEYDLNGKVIKS